MEEEFVRPLYLGESIAPFRVLHPALAVIPWEEQGNRLLDAGMALEGGYAHLGHWMSEAELLWEQHGRGGMSFVQRLDYYGNLRGQFPLPPLRVLYTTHGTLPAAALLRDRDGVVENTLLWLGTDNEAEGRYLTAVINSDVVLRRIQGSQHRGQWGARHITRLVFDLPIPRFDASKSLHFDLTQAAERAEQIAERVVLREQEHFVRARQRIRAALNDDGVTDLIDSLVQALLE